MLFQLLLFLGLCLLAHKTRPDEHALKKYLEEQRRQQQQHQSKGVSKLIPRFIRKLANAVTADDIQVQDHVLFTRGVVHNSGDTFIGCFGVWFAVGGGGQRQGSTAPLESIAADTSRADLEREEAVKAKARKDYKTSARNFERAAGLYATAGHGDSDAGNMLDAAAAYEEAYKMFRMASMSDSSMRALGMAAELYERYDRNGLRAARVYEQLGQIHLGHCQTGTSKQLSDGQLTTTRRQALDMLQKAGRLYDAEHDNRYMFGMSKVAELQAELGMFDEAIASWEALIRFSVDDRALVFRVPEYLFLQSLAIIGLMDWVRLDKHLDAACQTAPAFVDSREYALLSTLSQSVKDGSAEEWTAAVARYSQLSPLAEQWRQAVLATALHTLDTGDLR